MEHPIEAIAAAMFFSAFLKGITGLGFSTICLALLATIIDLPDAIPMVLIPSLASNVIVMTQAGHFKQTLIEFRWLYIAAVPGLLCGLYLLGVFPPAETAALLGGVLVTYGLFAFANPAFHLAPGLAKQLQVPIGLLTGLLNGATGSQVMPVLPYLMSLQLPPDRFVQAINISFTASSLVMLAGLARLGFLSADVMLYSALAIVPVYIGIKLGGILRRKLPEAAFRLAVLIMIIALGVNLVRTWWSAT